MGDKLNHSETYGKRQQDQQCALGLECCTYGKRQQDQQCALGLESCISNTESQMLVNSHRLPIGKINE